MNPLKRLTRGDLRSLRPAKCGDSSSSVETAQAFLLEQRLLNIGAFVPQLLDSSTSMAVTKYQNQYGLLATGQLDEPTIEVMALPRCAMRDGDLALAVECRWNVHTLRYAFENLPTGLSHSVVENALARAFSTWSLVSGITFSRVSMGETHNIAIAWRSAFDSDYDLVGADVAHADYPGSCSEVNPGGTTPLHFDGSECGWTDDAEWRRDDTLAFPVYDIETVALHEIGHILGLRHSPIPSDVLYGAVPRRAARSLSANDIARIRFLYELP